jgi:hypothetical protein
MNVLFLAAVIVAGIDAVMNKSLLAAAVSLLAAGHIWHFG